MSTADDAERGSGAPTAIHPEGGFGYGGPSNGGRRSGDESALARLAARDEARNGSGSASWASPETNGAGTTTAAANGGNGQGSQGGASARAEAATAERPVTVGSGQAAGTLTEERPTEELPAERGSADVPARRVSDKRAEPATRREPRAARAAGSTRGRRVRLTVSRVDPWSAMKMSFLLSVALGIAMVVATAVLWIILDAMGVFDKINGVIGQVIGEGDQTFNILDFVGFAKMVSLSVVIAVVDVILITAIATVGAFIYNVSSALVGGVQLTLTDD